MKLGLVSSILEDCNFEEMIDIASQMRLECVEVACWPNAKAERRYAGVSHIDVCNMDEARAEKIISYCREKKVEISSLAFYPNTMDGNLEKRKANIEHLYKVIDASSLLGVNMVTKRLSFFLKHDNKIKGDFCQVPFKHKEEIL